MVGAQGPPPPPVEAVGRGRSPPPEVQREKTPQLGEGAAGRHLPGCPPCPRHPQGGEEVVREGLSKKEKREQSAGAPLPTLFSKFLSFHSANPSPKNSQGSRGVREGNGGAWGLRAEGVQLPLHFGKRTRRQDSRPAFSPPTPGRGLGPVPGALAPGHELRDEVRTSARDRVAVPSPPPLQHFQTPPNP